MTRLVYQIEGQTLRMIRDHAARVIGYEQMASGASFATAEAIRIAEIVDELLKQPTVEVED